MSPCQTPWPGQSWTCSPGCGEEEEKMSKAKREHGKTKKRLCLIENDTGFSPWKLWATLHARPLGGEAYTQSNHEELLLHERDSQRAIYGTSVKLLLCSNLYLCCLKCIFVLYDLLSRSFAQITSLFSSLVLLHSILSNFVLPCVDHSTAALRLHPAPQLSTAPSAGFSSDADLETHKDSNENTKPIWTEREREIIVPINKWHDCHVSWWQGSNFFIQLVMHTKASCILLYTWSLDLVVLVGWTQLCRLVQLNVCIHTRTVLFIQTCFLK